MDSMHDFGFKPEKGRIGSTLVAVDNKHPPGVERGGGFDAELSRIRKKEETAGSEETRELAEEITHALSGFKSLRLSMDHDLNQVVVRVMDVNTNHVVRQIPGEKMLDLVKQMRDLEGVLLKATA